MKKLIRSKNTTKYSTVETNSKGTKFTQRQSTCQQENYYYQSIAAENDI